MEDGPTNDTLPDAGTPAAEEPQPDALFEGPPTPPAAPLALYRRYRPDTFAEMIGQEHVTEPLQRALVNNRVSHAYLFSGPRGCGKTTSARILARALNCEQGPAPVPCGECQSCRDLARGGPGSIDVIEIDAASHGGVDDARDLRERAFFAPVHSRYKIYIVDEAHMVTAAGFNALLKLVEEPPEHVKFIFATTEPDKVIGTIRSRTHHYPFRLVPPKVLSTYLAKICTFEGVAVEPAVLPLVVRAGAGSVRDSLSVLDQLLGGSGEEGLQYAQAAALLGFTPDALLDEIMDAFAAGDGAGVFACIDKVIEVGQDPRRFAEDLLRRLRDLVVVAAVPDALGSGLVDVAEDQGERLQTQAAALGAGELTRAAEVLAAGLSEMRGTTAPRLYLELMCARVLLPGADVDDRGIHARLDRLERRVGMTGAALSETGGPSQQVQQPPVRATRHEAAEPRSQTGTAPAEALGPPTAHAVAPMPPSSSQSSADRPSSSQSPASQSPASQSSPGRGAPAPEPPSRSEPEPSVPPGSAEAAVTPQPVPVAAAQQETTPADRSSSTTGGLSTADVRRLWPEVLEEVKRRRRFTWILLSQNSQVLEVHDRVLVLAMANAGARDSFARGGSEAVLADALVQVLGADLRIQIVVDSATGEPGRSAPPSAPAGRAQPSGQGHPSADPPGWEAAAPGASAPPQAPRHPDPSALAEPGSAQPPQSGPSQPRSHQPGSYQPGSHQPATAASGEQGSTERVSPPAEPQPSPSPRSPRSALPDGGSSDPGPFDGARRDDVTVDDSLESHSELLHSRLGAEMIDEQDAEER